MKRKGDPDPTQTTKKAKTEPSTSPPPPISSQDGITEEAIRRYLQRKPMTVKHLLVKFASKKLNLSNEVMTQTIVRHLKHINPDRQMINNKMHLSLKKTE